MKTIKRDFSLDYDELEMELEDIKYELLTKGLVRMTGLGTLYLKRSPKRRGRCPHTMKEYDIPERTKAHFKPSKGFINEYIGIKEKTSCTNKVAKEIRKGLINAGEVVIRGLGRFWIYIYNKKLRNPRTGESLGFGDIITIRYRPAFWLRNLEKKNGC